MNKCYIINEYKLIYVQLPKCANTSILKSLCQLSDWKHKKEILKATDPYEIHGFLKKNRKSINLDDRRYKDYFKFTLCRNPWSRAVSHYNDKIKDKKRQKAFFGQYCGDFADLTFERYCEIINKVNNKRSEVHFKSQTSIIGENNIKKLWIGKIEDDSWNKLQNLILKRNCVKLPDLGKHNKKVSKHYSTFYTKKTREIILKRYADDINNFNYQF